MSAAVASAEHPATLDAALPRSVRLVRVVVLLIGGAAITFSATMHEQLGFDLALATGLLVGIGLAHLIEWFAGRAIGAGPVALLLAVISFAGAAALPFQTSAIGFAVVVAAWALASSLLEFVGNTVRPGSRKDAALIGAAGVLLALLALLLREDEVSVVGLLGAYAVIAGVFLGISAFDTRQAGGRRGASPDAELSDGQRSEHAAA